MYWVNGEALQVIAVDFYCKSCENPHQVCTASHVRCISTCNELKGLHGKIIITIQCYTRKRDYLLVAIGKVADGSNKFVIFFCTMVILTFNSYMYLIYTSNCLLAQLATPICVY